MTTQKDISGSAAVAPERFLLSSQAVDAWPVALLAAGYRVIAAVVAKSGEVQYGELTAKAPDATGLGKGLPAMSPKQAWFPRAETILRIRRGEQGYSVEEPEEEYPKIVIFGARPCDASAPQILAPLFGWDFHDPFFEDRLRQLSFVVLGCNGPVDSACFCTSVGIDPAGETAGDVLLTALPDGSYSVEARTAAGGKLVAALPEAAKGGSGGVEPDAKAVADIRDKARVSVAKRFDPDVLRTALERNFGNLELWQDAAKSCLACGTCAYTCPTCHCFDIQDEMAGNEGVRQKNWDACAFPLFTLHTSGHNPRPDQASRWRQRLSHKFRYYPEKFGKILCTGCGRCMRQCPGNMDLLADIERLVSTKVEAGGNGKCECEVDTKGFAAPTPGIMLEGATPNIYRPYLMKITEARDETPDVRTLRLEFTDPAEAERFNFRVGQFGLYSALGEGESTFCIASSATRKGYIECTFRQAGRVTKALRRLNVGDLMGFRGPYGNSFPVESWKGKDLLFIAGGIALPPMRSVIWYCLDNRKDYGNITIIYGARTWSDHVYKNELSEWEARPDVDLRLCIDWKFGKEGPIQAEAEAGWWPLNLKDPMASTIDPTHRRYTGFVPHLVEAVKPKADNCIAVLCGPPIMIKFTMASLKKLGFQSEGVYTTLENRMKCGLGKCGRCNVGPIYVCKEGPVFTAAQVEKLPPEM